MASAFYRAMSGVRAWKNGDGWVMLPSANNDVVFVFYAFLEAFLQGRDWASADLRLVSAVVDFPGRIGCGGAGGTFEEDGACVRVEDGTFAVEYLGLPREAMPLYSDEACWKKKASRICSFVMEVGNFWHNRDNSYYSKYPYMIRKAVSLGRRCGDIWRHAMFFPLDSIRFFPMIVWNGIGAAMRGK